MGMVENLMALHESTGVLVLSVIIGGCFGLGWLFYYDNK